MDDGVNVFEYCGRGGIENWGLSHLRLFGCDGICLEWCLWLLLVGVGRKHGDEQTQCKWQFLLTSGSSKTPLLAPYP
jgi:hypothetical protein